MKYVADFETITTEPTRVWAWGIAGIDSEEFSHGKDIESFMGEIFERNGRTTDTYYFHNLKFDLSFILDYSLKNGWRWTNKKETENNEFTTLITDRGVYYCADFYKQMRTKNGKVFTKHIKFLDSLKIIGLKVSQIPKAFGLSLSKLDLEYDAERPVGYEMTQEEIAYLKNDCLIVRDALRIMFDWGMNKMTGASNAMHGFKQKIGKKNFERWFPEIWENEPVDKIETSMQVTEHEKKVLVTDRTLRATYKGGWCYVKESIKGLDLGAGIVLDVNSLYPYVMRTKLLPYGVPIIEKEIKEITGYPLSIINFTCKFEIKANKLPTIQIKNSLYFSDTEYLTTSGDEEVELSLTNIDYDLFMDHYEVFDIEIRKVYYFRGSDRIFAEYIDYWGGVKEQAAREGNAGLKTIAKGMMNQLYGKFAVNPITGCKKPYLEDGKVKYEILDAEYRDPIYLPMAIFITSHARHYTITTSQQNYDRFAYADTDSMHMMGTNMPENIEIDSAKLGAWDHEKTFTRARFIRAKRYIEEVAGKLEITCAGMPAACYEYVTWDNFKIGAPPFPGKLAHKNVEGGAILKDTYFTLK